MSTLLLLPLLLPLPHLLNTVFKTFRYSLCFEIIFSSSLPSFAVGKFSTYASFDKADPSMMEKVAEEYEDDDDDPEWAEKKAAATGPLYIHALTYIKVTNISLLISSSQQSPWVRSTQTPF